MQVSGHVEHISENGTYDAVEDEIEGEEGLLKMSDT